MSFCFPHSRQGIRCFAGLTDDDRQGIIFKNWIPITKFRSQVHFHRNPGQFFNDIFSCHTGMISRAAGNNKNFFQIFNLLIRHTKFMNKYVVFLYPWENGIPYSLWLFMNFFHHKMLVTAFFCCRYIPLNFCYFFFNDIQVLIINCHVVPGQFDNLTIFKNINLSCMFQYGRNIRGDIIPLFGKSDNERTVFFYCNDLVRIIFINDSKSIGTFDTAHNLRQCF